MIEISISLELIAVPVEYEPYMNKERSEEKHCFILLQRKRMFVYLMSLIDIKDEIIEFEVFRMML